MSMPINGHRISLWGGRVVLIAGLVSTFGSPAAHAQSEAPKTLVIESITPDAIRLDEQLAIQLNFLPDKSKNEWVLYLNRVPIAPLRVESISTDQRTLYFRLNRTVLKPYMERLISGLNAKVELEVALGTDKEMLTAPCSQQLRLVIYSPERAFAFVVFAVALLAALTVMTRQSKLLRGRRLDGTPGPYSLALTQMAFWFVLTVFGYLYIGIVTGDYSAISPSMLILLGISATTGVAAVTIDDDKMRRQVNGGSPGQLQRRLMPAPIPKQFILELISDDDGVSLHRFQILIWTIVLGGVFVSEVVNKLTMPEFNATLLTLMGISSGTYLAFKFPENKDIRPPNPPQPPAIPPTPPTPPAQ